MRGVCAYDTLWVGMPARRELHDSRNAFVFRQFLGANPVGPEEVGVSAAFVVRPAPERREGELLARDRLSHAIVPV